MALSEVIAKLGFELDSKPLNQASGQLEDFINKVKGVGKLFAFGVVATGIKGFIQDIVNLGSEIVDQSAALGVSTDALQRWRFAGKLVGVEAGEMSMALRRLQQSAAGSDEAGSDQAKMFENLGVQVKDANGEFKSADILLGDVGAAIDGLGSNAEKTAIATKLFGRAGAKLLPVFKGGKEAIKEALKEIEKVGGLLSGDMLEKMDEMGDATDRLDASWMGFKATMAVQVLPIITEWLNKAAEWGGKFIEWGKASGFFQSALLSLGAVTLGPLIAALGRLGLAIAGPAIKFAVLFVVIDDLRAFFQGGDSLIGRGLDAIFGAGTQNNAREALKGIWAELAEHDWAGAADKLVDALDAAGSKMANSKFVQEFGKFNEEAKGMVVGPALHSKGVEDWQRDSKARLGEWWEEQKAAASAGLDSIFEAYTAFNDKINAWIDEQIAIFQRGWDRIVTAAKDAGAAIVDGFVDGLTSGIDKVKGAIDAVFGDDQVGGIKKAWQQHSPSKVAANIGMNIDKGFAQGLMSGNATAAFNRMVPGPMMRSASVNQTNNINMPITGVRDPMQAAQMASAGISRQNRTALSDLESALVALG